jgi:hypothetical protein
MDILYPTVIAGNFIDEGYLAKVAASPVAALA